DPAGGVNDGRSVPLASHRDRPGRRRGGGLSASWDCVPPGGSASGRTGSPSGGVITPTTGLSGGAAGAGREDDVGSGRSGGASGRAGSRGLRGGVVGRDGRFTLGFRGVLPSSW